jgi:hypothetical protein
MRGKRAAQRSGRHRGATAIADDRNECRSPRSLPGSASVSPACAVVIAPPGSASVRTPTLAPRARLNCAAWERGRLARLRAGGARTQSIRTPKLPLLPSWEKGAGGMRGNGARECRTSLISPKNSTLASRGGEMRGNGALQQRDHRLRRASSRMACRLRISATSYLVGIEPAIGRIFTIAGNCPERP